MKEEKTRYPGVVTRTDSKGQKTFYIRYRCGGRGSKLIVEPVGKASSRMTAAKASIIRSERINGKERSNKGQREATCLDTETHKQTRWTLENLWEAYKQANPKDEKNDTRSRETWLFNKRLKKIFGNKTVDDLTTKDIDHFRNQLLKMGLKPATVRLPMELIRRLFNFGEKQGYCIVPRTLHFNFPKIDNEKAEYLTDEELQRYEEALENYASTKDSTEKQFFLAFAHFIMHTGIRRKAAILLRWNDCDFE